MQKGFAPVLIIILVALIASLGGFLVYQNSRTKPSPTSLPQQTHSTPTPKRIENMATNSADTANWKTYTNTKYGYQFDYPPYYSVSTNHPDYIYVGPNEDYLKGLEIGGKILQRIQITPQIDDDSTSFQNNYDIDTSKLSFSDFAFWSIQLRCSADGPGSSIYCDKIIKQSKFLNKHGLEVYELYVNSIRDNPRGRENIVVGPIFVFDISKQTNNVRALLVAVDFFDPISKEDEELLRKIVDSLRF